MARIQLQQAWIVGLLLLLLIQSLQPSNCEMGSSSRISSISSGTADGTEEWGYTDVRPGAHMFWWLYYSKIILQTDVPLVLWIQGGPGASGVGFGNFQEVGPLTTDLEPRESTWLNVAHLLFVDNPVGTGFSYVDNTSLLSRNNDDATADLLAFLWEFFQIHEALRTAPFYIVAESYGGKFASQLGVALQRKRISSTLDFNFQGIALGDTWISPIDFLFAWGPLLKSFSEIDEAGNNVLLRFAQAAEKEMMKGNFTNATLIWADMEEAVLDLTDNVDFYNLLQHETSSDLSFYGTSLEKTAARHLRVTQTTNLTQVMNGPVRKKLGIIPSTVSWSQSSGAVFGAFFGDFMKDTISQVDELLALNVNLTIYSGQLDLICCTAGTDAWLQKLKWAELTSFNKAHRSPLYCSEGGKTAAFIKKHKNLTFYWIMDAGHMVPTDNPCMALKMLKMITGQSTENVKVQAG
ncbi:unnamed protein product [Sphagnum jensenii]|uniref:Carboxypeptidase n=1 Tax=Sphagnum jensenii TaxID=128206 RepID=A0ABP0V7X5_9BRYO